jgi:hypothetical protein
VDLYRSSSSIPSRSNSFVISVTGIEPLSLTKVRDTVIWNKEQTFDPPHTSTGETVFNHHVSRWSARQCPYKRNIQKRSRHRCWRGKSISITYSERVFVALGIQHEMRVCRIISSSVTCPALPHFSAFSHKGTTFGKKRYGTQNVCFDFLYNLRPKHFSF